MSAAEFIQRFKYRRSGIPGAIRDVRKSAEGQCQDFAWTVLILECGGKWRAIAALLTFRAVIWRCLSPSNGIIPRHAVLQLRGKWIDSTVREWRDTPAPHKLRWPMGAPALVGLAVAAKVWGLW